MLLQRLDLGLTKSGRRDIGGSQTTAAALHVSADPGQGLEPQPAQPVDLGVTKR